MRSGCLHRTVDDMNQNAPSIGSTLPRLTETRGRFFASFMGLALIGGATMGMIDLAVNLYSIHLGATSRQIGLVKSLQGLGVMVMVIPAGFLIDAYGAAVVFIAGCCIIGIVCLALPLASTPAILPLFAAVLGLGVSFRITSLSSVFLIHIDAVGNEKAGWIRGAHSLGFSLLGPLGLGVLLARLAFGTSFLAISLMMGATVFLAFHVLGCNYTRISNVKDQAQSSFGGTVSNIRALGSDETMVQTAMLEFLNVVGLSCFTTFVVEHALRDLHVDRSLALGLVATEGVTFIMALFLGGMLLRHWKQRTLYAASALLIAVALVLIAWSKEIALLRAGALLLGVGAGMIAVMNLSAAAHVRALKGQVAGLLSLSSSSGMCLGPLLGGVICQKYSFNLLFYGLAAVFLVGGTLSLVFVSDRTGRSPKRETEDRAVLSEI